MELADRGVQPDNVAGGAGGESRVGLRQVLDY